MIEREYPESADFIRDAAKALLAIYEESEEDIPLKGFRLLEDAARAFAAHEKE